MDVEGAAGAVVRVLDSVTTHVRPLILEHFRPDSCIASTRVTIEVLKYFNVPAEPLPVSGWVMNAEATRMLTDGATFEDIGNEVFKWEPSDEGGPWTIGLGYGGETRAEIQHPGWAGHLVAAIPKLSIIVDNSIDQISRPLKGLVFEPMWTVIDDKRWWNDPNEKAIFQTESGTTIVLEHNSADPDGFRKSTNWSLNGPYRSIFKQIIGTAIRGVKADLASH